MSFSVVHRSFSDDDADVPPSGGIDSANPNYVPPTGGLVDYGPHPPTSPDDEPTAGGMTLLAVLALAPLLLL